LRHGEDGLGSVGGGGDGVLGDVVHLAVELGGDLVRGDGDGDGGAVGVVGVVGVEAVGEAVVSGEQLPVGVGVVVEAANVILGVLVVAEERLVVGDESLGARADAGGGAHLVVGAVVREDGRSDSVPERVGHHFRFAVFALREAGRAVAQVHPEPAHVVHY